MGERRVRMPADVLGATLFGIDALPVEVEVRVLGGRMGGLVLTGLPGAAVRESKDRVRAAIQASAFRFPPRTLLVHLAPGDLRKEGPLLDLPIALGILAATDQLPGERIGDVLAAGELALDGRVRPVRGLLAIAAAARRRGVRTVLAPAECAPHAALASGLKVIPVATLTEAVGWLSGRLELDPARPAPAEDESGLDEDLADVRGQEAAKEALIVAAAGLHNLLLMGPPGSGKTMLARRLRALLPDLDEEASLECSRIRSVVDARLGTRLRRPPFRAPHHTSSTVSLVGGGALLRPGEVTLAHRGVLFLDELPEFPRVTIEALRQPLEERQITVARASGSVTFPADLCLVAAMNPCPCGYRGHRKVACRCPESEVRRYGQRISGPLLDRFDLRVEVPAVDVRTVLAPAPAAAGSDDAKRRIERARALQRRRFAGTPLRANAQMSARDVDRYCAHDAKARELLVAAAESQRLSARGVKRILRVARTIADLREAERVGEPDVALALGFRVTLPEAD